MTHDVTARAQAGLVRRAVALDRDVVVLALATVAVWGHTADEIRIGEYVAVPFGLATCALLAGWPRMRARSRGAGALLLGLLWAVAVIPYHIVPLSQGVVTWQNVSGVLRIVGGVPMAALGVRELLRPRNDEPPRQ